MTSDLKKLAKKEFDKMKLEPCLATDLAWYWWKKAFEAAWERFNNQTIQIPKQDDNTD